MLHFARTFQYHAYLKTIHTVLNLIVYCAKKTSLDFRFYGPLNKGYVGIGSSKSLKEPGNQQGPLDDKSSMLHLHHIPHFLGHGKKCKSLVLISALKCLPRSICPETSRMNMVPAEYSGADKKKKKKKKREKKQTNLKRSLIFFFLSFHAKKIRYIVQSSR